jgi:hypothetical protein
VVKWEASASLPARDIEPVDIPLLVFTDNHAGGQVNLPDPGTWILSFTLRLSDFNEATVSQLVVIK